MPEVLDVSGDGEFLEWELRVPRDLVYLRGHFTDRPIVAGVVLVHWAIGAIEAHRGAPLDIAALEAVKFHDFLFPEHVFRLRVRPGDRRWHYEFSREGRKIASGRIVEAPPGPTG